MRSYWTVDEIRLLTLAYTNPHGVDLLPLSEAMGRSRAALACKADQLGLCARRGGQIRTTLSKKNMSKAQKRLALIPGVVEKRSANVSAAFKRNGHPRGMLGKHHDQKAKDAISRFHFGKKQPRERVEKQMATRYNRYGTLAPKVSRGNWKSEWHEIDGIKFFARSRWESNYAHFLQWKKCRGEIIKWEHEPETFWFKGIKRGVVSYLPDFKITLPCGGVEYHEVKGWMDAKSKTKIKRMAKYHPKVKLEIIDSKRYRVLNKQLKGIVPGWV